MLRKLGGIDTFVTVISAGRPQNVGPMTAQVGAATWYVPHSQRDAYAQHGAVSFGEGSDVAVVPVRNRALRDAWDQGAICVQLDDDLKWAAFAINGRARRTEPARAIETLVRRLSDSDFKLAGAAPTNNPYFVRKANSTNLFIRSGVIAVKPCGILMDERLKVKFDYDYTINHYRRYGGVLRCDDLIFDFQQRTNAGGHVDTRSERVEQEAIAYLLQKWGPWVKRHPRRKNEVLLNLPRRKREVLT